MPSAGLFFHRKFGAAEREQERLIAVLALRKRRGPATPRLAIVSSITEPSVREMTQTSFGGYFVGVGAKLVLQPRVWYFKTALVLR